MPCMHQHKWRALAVLGALLMVIFLYGPLTCASMPTPIMNNISLLEFVEPIDAGTVSNKSEKLVQVLNATSKRIDRQLSKTGHLNTAKITSVDIKKFWLSTTVSPDILDNPDVIKNNKSIINNSVSSSNNNINNNNNNNNSNSDLVFNSNEYILRNQTTTELSILSLKLTTENYEKLGVTKKMRLTRTDRSLHTQNNFNNNQNNNNNNNNKNSNNNSNSSNIIQRRKRRKDSGLDRNERSANLSHITGTTRKIQLYIKNRYLQILPDGTVNGTQDELNDYTILQRTTVEIGRIKIQSVATCLFLCMDTCGTVYGSKEFSDDCIFNEAIEQHHYNTYSSSHHSNPRRKLYLALNKHGQPRKIQIPSSRPLGKLATYTKSLTQTVPHERVEKLITRLFGPTYIRHGLKQLCDSGKSITELTAKTMKPKPKCNLKKQQQVMTKKKRNKRRCRPDEPESDLCIKPPITNHQQQQQIASSSSSSPSPNSGGKRNSDSDHPNNNNNKPNQLQQGRNRKNQKMAGQANPKHEKCSEDDCKRNKNQKKNKAAAANQQTSVSNSSINSNSNSSTTNLKKNRQNKLQLKKGGNHQQKVLNPRKSTTLQPTTKLAHQSRRGGIKSGVLKVIPTTEATTIAAILSSTQQSVDANEMMYQDDSLLAYSSTESFIDDDDSILEAWDDNNLIGTDDGGDDDDDDDDSDEFDARK